MIILMTGYAFRQYGGGCDKKGCIRLYPETVPEYADRSPVGQARHRA